ncbi:hypothetical protein [Roseovarius sp.]|uniref:hypothetical protein n=1 Tax=Roseovarius sp. TaxID=1486281 RepID=UPI003D1205E1
MTDFGLIINAYALALGLLGACMIYMGLYAGVRFSSGARFSVFVVVSLGGAICAIFLAARFGQALFSDIQFLYSVTGDISRPEVHEFKDNLSGVPWVAAVFAGFFWAWQVVRFERRLENSESRRLA